MASKPLNDEQEPLELTEELEPDQVDEPETEDGDEQPGPDSGDEPEEETVIAFDGEEQEDDLEGESSTVKRLRERNREQTKQLRERDRRIAELSFKPRIEVGPKPTLESCEYDEERYETELDAWKDRQVEVSKQEEHVQEQNRRANESWQQDVTAYAQRKTTLGVSDYEVSETAVSAALSDVQQAVIVKAANDPAALIYALGKSETKLAELAKYDDPIKLAAAVARMEGAVKVMKRKKAPELDRPQRGSASIEQLSSDQQLEKLEKEAERTGVRTKVIAYRRKLKAQEK